MLASVASGLGGFFDKRWLLAFFFPVATFALATLLILGNVEVIEGTLQRLAESPIELRALTSFAALAALILLASLLSTLWAPLTRLYEGYWGWAWLRNGLRNRFCKLVTHLEQVEQYWTHEDAVAKRRDDLVSKVPPGYEPGAAKTWAFERARGEATEMVEAAAAERLMNYPDMADLMPTRLGNILRTAETYPAERYGLDGVICWPRLLAVLPEEMRNRLAEAEVGMDLLLVVSFLSTLLGLVVLPLALVLKQDPVLCAYAGATLIISGAAYVGSLSAARRFGELVKTAFDLYRWPLMSALHINLPKDLEEEKALGRDVSEFLYRGTDPLTATYETKTPDPPPASDDSNASLGRVLAATMRELFLRPTKTAGTVDNEDTDSQRKTARPLPAKPVKRPRDSMGLLWLTPLGIMTVPMWLRATAVTKAEAPPAEFAIKATAELTFNGTLKSGESITAVFVEKEPGHKPKSYTDVIVSQAPTIHDKGEPKGAIVLRVPGHRAEPFARDLATKTVLLTRVPITPRSTDNGK